MFVFHPIELLNEWATRRNRTPRAPLDPEPFFQLWTAADGSALRSIPLLARPPARLVVVMTHARPAPCERLLRLLARAIEVAGQSGQTALAVLRDADGSDYSRARSAAAEIPGPGLWLESRAWLGKSGFWRSYQTAFSIARLWRPEQCLFLHDDVEFESDLLVRADTLWSATSDDPARRVLYLFSSEGDEPEGRWIKHRRKEMPAKLARQTNWFDLQAFMVDRRFFELLDYRIIPVHPNRWRRKPSLSSGVGRQLTVRLFGRANTYQAWPPLVCHGAEPSLANPEARGMNDLDNREEYARAVAARAATPAVGARAGARTES